MADGDGDRRAGGETPSAHTPTERRSAMKRIRRIIMVRCTDCWGTGRSVSGSCITCKGKGEVERVVVEIVQDDQVQEA